LPFVNAMVFKAAITTSRKMRPGRKYVFEFLKWILMDATFLQFRKVLQPNIYMFVVR
jgi:hypothetical protein